MDIKEILRLFDKFSQSAVDELEVSIDNVSIRLKKNITPQEPMIAVTSSRTASVPALASSSEGGTGKEEEKQEVKEEQGKSTKLVLSPIVGTFYRAPAPDAPPFVVEGDRVPRGKTLAVIEAMKIMNHLEAEYEMEIVTILVKNGEMVDFGAPLFEVIEK